MRAAAFIDRDGTIIRDVGYITCPSQVELLPNAQKAIRLINDAGMLAIVITNQPVIAHGICSDTMLDDIHSELRRQLERYDAYLDAIYHCPHAPISNFATRRSEYCIECECRKPRPGLIAQAAEDFAIDVPRSAFFGDSERDFGAAQSANMPFFLIDRLACSLYSAVARWVRVSSVADI
jgi:mannose-1-phosphate guanylyltransferase/phosphomannomutase